MTQLDNEDLSEPVRTPREPATTKTTMEQGSSESDRQTAPIPHEHLAVRAAGKACTILIADDDPRIRNALERQLRSHGHEVLQAEDGERALAQIRAQRVDLVFLDIMMPHAGGLETLNEIHSISPHSKCVLMSGKASLLHKAALLGADWVLHKPFGRTHLLSALEVLYVGSPAPHSNAAR